MKSRFLFPNRFIIIGLIISIPSIFLGLLVLFKDLSLDIFTVKFPFQYYFSDTLINETKNGVFHTKTSAFNFTDEIATVGSIIGLIFIAFSKLKVEDEYVSKVRLESLQWAIYFNFGLLIIATIFVHGFAYFNVTIFQYVYTFGFFLLPDSISFCF